MVNSLGWKDNNLQLGQKSIDNRIKQAASIVYHC